jgi:hypothetical protein
MWSERPGRQERVVRRGAALRVGCQRGAPEVWSEEAKHGGFLCAKSSAALIQFRCFFLLASESAGRPSACQKTALWCGSTRCAEGRGYADLRGDREGCKLVSWLTPTPVAVRGRVRSGVAASSVTLAAAEIPIYFVRLRRVRRTEKYLYLLASSTRRYCTELVQTYCS